MASTVVGLFDDRETAQTAVSDLTHAGFRRQDISIVAADPGGKMYQQHVDHEGNIAGEGAASGLTTGAVVGGLLGVLIGAGLIFVPVGVVAAGPIAGLVAGGAAGAAAGGIVGALIGLGIPKEDADVYAEGVRRGGTMVMVTADDADVARAHEILDRDGAIDIEDRGTRYRAEGFSTYDSNAPVLDDDAIALERERYRANTSGTTSESVIGTQNPYDRSDVRDSARVRSYTGGACADRPNDLPGIQTGGHNADGSPDTRGITEKIADTVTGDRIDDKTGKRVD